MIKQRKGSIRATETSSHGGPTRHAKVVKYLIGVNEWAINLVEYGVFYWDFMYATCFIKYWFIYYLKGIFLINVSCDSLVSLLLYRTEFYSNSNRL